MCEDIIKYKVTTLKLIVYVYELFLLFFILSKRPFKVIILMTIKYYYCRVKQHGIHITL